MEAQVWRALLATCIALLLAGLAAGLWLFLRARPRPFTRRLVLLALGIELALALVWLDSMAGGWPDMWRWFANVNTEYTPGTLFSGSQLLVAGITALGSASLLREGRRSRLLLLMVSGVTFLYLGLDELFEGHEYLWLSAPELNVMGIHYWRLLYLAGGAGLALVILLVRRLQVPAARRALTLLLIGLGITGISGIVVEHVTLQAFCWTDADSGKWLCDNPQQWLVFEEIFEMVGVSLALGAILGRAPTTYAEFAKRFVAAKSAA